MMASSRKWMFPVLLGGAMVAAGVLFYFVHADVDLSATRGAIAHRDVYRDADVKPGDVGTPGAAPVAVTAVLQSSNFKELAKNPAFQGLMATQSFRALSHNPAFFALLNNASFQQMMAFQQFQELVKSQSNISELRQAMIVAGSNASLNSNLNAGLIMQLRQNSAFTSLMQQPAFTTMLKQDAFMMLLSNSSFAQLMHESAFLQLTSNAAFQNAMLQGNAAQLTTAMGAGGKEGDR